jgi:hypothetical protein
VDVAPKFSPDVSGDHVIAAVASQREAALNALAYAHAEIAALKARVAELEAQTRVGDV